MVWNTKYTTYSGICIKYVFSAGGAAGLLCTLTDKIDGEVIAAAKGSLKARY
jgi:hypothetical protein